MNTSTLEVAFALTLLIGVAIMDQKQYDYFNEQLGCENSKSALAFAEIFGSKNKQEDKDDRETSSNNRAE